MFGDVFAVPNEAIVDELVARLEELTELAPEIGSLKARDALAWTIGCFTNKWIGCLYSKHMWPINDISYLRGARARVHGVRARVHGVCGMLGEHTHVQTHVRTHTRTCARTCVRVCAPCVRVCYGAWTIISNNYI